MRNQDLNVVFGAGAIGLAIAEELVARGKRVRVVNRSGRPSPELADAVEFVCGDATDANSAFAASKGATVVYNATNAPHYHKWPEQFPPLQSGVLEGAARAGARLVVMENLYMYGSTGGKLITEELPYKATGPRGRTRAQMAQELQAAHASGRIQVVSGRASDFFGPRVKDSAVGATLFRAALSGKKAQIMVSADNLHTFSYVRDIARGLVVLGENESAFGQAWHLPAAPAMTPRAFIELVYHEAGQPLQLQVLPKLTMRALGLLVPPMQKISELFYEFSEPFVVSHIKFDQAFGSQATPIAEAIQATLGWYKAN